MISDAELYRRAAEAFSSEPNVPDVLIQESFDSVFGRRAHWRDVRSRFRRLPLGPVLSILSALSVDLERGRHPFDAVVQYRVVEALSDGSRRMRALLRRLTEPPVKVVIHEEQLAIAAKMAIVFCESSRWPQNGNQEFLEVLLALNSLRANEIDGEGNDTRTVLLRHEVRATATDNESESSVLRRFGAFINWARSEDARKSRHYLNLDDIFAALGLSYDDFAAATMAFYSHFGGTAVNAEGKRDYSAFLNVPVFVNSVARPETLNRWFELTSIPIAAAKASLVDSPLSTSIASLHDLMATPLIRIDDFAYCPALRYLPNVAGSGLLFRLGDLLKERNGIKASDQLRGFFAAFLEAHVKDAVDSAMRNVGAATFPEISFGRANRSSDVAVFLGDDAVFIDVNSKRFRIKESVIALDPASIERDLRQMIIAKVLKIADRANDFRSGALTYPGIDPNTIRNIYALVVTPQGIPRLAGITDVLQNLLPDVPAGLANWEYFDLGEIEMLRDVYEGDLDLAELIRAKQRDEFGKHRSLTNYMYFRMRNRLMNRRSREEMLSDPWFQLILQTARQWGFASNPADDAPEPNRT